MRSRQGRTSAHGLAVGPTLVGHCTTQGIATSSLSDLGNRRETVGKRGQIGAHSRRIVGLKREGARLWTAVPASQQIRPKSDRLLVARKVSQGHPYSGRRYGRVAHRRPTQTLLIAPGDFVPTLRCAPDHGRRSLAGRRSAAPRTYAARVLSVSSALRYLFATNCARCSPCRRWQRSPQ